MAIHDLISWESWTFSRKGKTERNAINPWSESMLCGYFYSQVVVVAFACFLCQVKAIDVFVKVSVLLNILLRLKMDKSLKFC